MSPGHAHRPSRRQVLAAAWAAALLAAAACSSDARAHPAATNDGMPAMTSTPPVSGEPAPSATHPGANPLPGMPALLNPHDVYAADRPGALSAAVRRDLRRVYVPNHASNTVSVIDPATGTVAQTVRVPAGPEHVVPAWDLRTLWVNSDTGNALTPINPATGTFGRPVRVDDPYNLYFTPDGRYAVVMAERRHQIVFRDAHTMAVHKVVPVNCAGVNHADFSPDGRYFIASCEFSGDLLKVDTEQQRVVAQQHLPAPHPMPQDVKISPDGSAWYVADMQTSGLWILDGDTFGKPRFLATGQGAHGLYVSRDSRYMYVTNRGEGSVSVLEFATNRLIAKWRIPGGGSPDMGGLSADGTILWLSGRYNHVVYALNTTTGRPVYRINVGVEPHGLCVWPQPGRYSLGHTGILR
jgi:YVTN family beta-propeller protein